MPFIRDLITIPERVHQGDFVLKLSEGVAHAEQTLRDYVVTPELGAAFKNALGFIQQSVTSHSSKAAYLRGSFGSGKSHFMAVLNLLLAGHAQARSMPELAEVVAQLGWAQGKRFLMVPYHMIGASDMESAVLGQYADHVRRLHPTAPVPGFYLAEELFRDASALRQRLGDEAFFSKLNEAPGSGSTGGDGWGELEGGWDAISFEAALLEPPEGEERGRLVGALISQFFTAYQALAGAGESFVPLDAGLAIMSRHARDLGYDAVILFLDELVLWLASHASDPGFVSREGTKLVKLVEATHADRPIPLVSFVARQRDLRDLVGENLSGAAGVQFSDVLKHWEARFHRITLEDRNLPAIAEKRVLRPVSDDARKELARAFDDVLRLRRDVLDTLLATDADRDMFRKVYPFSPALVQTLIAVSSVLQRERTALKLMLQLLVDRRADLELGQLIPVGDLWDVIAEGDEPFSEGMRVHFENAKRLFNQRLLPVLESKAGTTWEALRLGQAEPMRAKALRNDARLLKTLLLAALVPEVESLKALTATRLAALNHGTFKSPIPGQEAQQVLRKLRDWAGEVGELKVTDDANPVLSIQITGVDLEPVLKAAEVVDNPGNRRKTVRELLFKELGIEDKGAMFHHFERVWRGTRREVEVVYENVREMADDRLKDRTGSWTVVLDIPFDEPHRTPADDLARLGEYRGGSTHTLVWLPSFLSSKAEGDLKRYVVLDHILQGERFEDYATHLSFVDRVQAKALAKNQRDSLRTKLIGHLEVAYGVRSEPRDSITHELTAEQQFRSLDPTLAPRPPVGVNLQGAFESLLDQLFTHRWPGHPNFDTEIKGTLVRRLWPEVRAAIEAPQHRGPIADAGMRKLIRSVVNPLRLGQMGETHLLVETNWQSHFAQQQALDAQGGPLTVARVRRWIDQPRPMGLPTELQNLIILAWAQQTNRRLLLNGGPCEAEVDRLADEVELREQALPALADWERAIKLAGEMLGVVAPQTLSAANVGKLVADVKKVARERQSSTNALVDALRARCERYAGGLTGARWRTARASQTAVAALAAADEATLVATMAQLEVDTSETAMGRSITQSQGMADTLAATRWTLFDGLVRMTDARAEDAKALLADLATLLGTDEYVAALKPGLQGLEQMATELLTAVVIPPAPPVPPVPPQPPQPPQVQPPLPPVPAPAPSPDVELIDEASNRVMDAQAASSALAQLQKKLAGDDTLELTVSWRLVRRRKLA
ncbi:MAG: phage resistance protein [Burkholderiales bacterium]|nr:phage resistance protein [Burkholderiales bacterium]